MNTATSNYQETSQFIHQRYDDTAYIIFQQQQKIRTDEKRREQQQQKYSGGINRPFLPVTNYPAEFSRFGNRGVVATDQESLTAKTVTNNSDTKSQVSETRSPVTPTKTKPAVSPNSHSKPAPGIQPAVKSSTDHPDHTVVRRQRRRRKKVVVSIESSV